MSFSRAEHEACQRLVRWALEEDLGPGGDPAADRTSQAVLPEGLTGQAALVARQPGVLAGLPAAEMTFALVDPSLGFQPERQEGDTLQPGDRVALISGPLRALLTGERTALNFVQRLSGVATLTRRLVDACAGTSAQILDTRKTTPGWRLLEKYAVRQGGGTNHRLGLYDGVLIKDNHLAGLRHDRASGLSPVREAVRLARERHGQAIPLEIEVDTLEQLEEALGSSPDIILLDNMTNEQLREAVQRRDATAPGVLLEASGGVHLDTVRAIAQTGVDRISVGALTHSAPALDLGLDYL
jgi:nicotinate-nucleotide pyrophosphorylase (carboxylating)